MTTTAPEAYSSFRALVRLVLQSALPRPQKAVLQALLAHARADLTVYHAQGQLAWECDYTRPVIRKALAALEAQAILRVRQGPRQHRATEYALDLSRLPSRAPYYAQDADAVSTDGAASPRLQDRQFPAEGRSLTGQRAIELSAEGPIRPDQHETHLPPDHAEGYSVTPRGQMAFPRIKEQEEKKCFLHHEPGSPEVSVPLPDTHRPAPTPKSSRPGTRRTLETAAPDTLPITEALRHWAADAVPGLPLDHERDKFLCYARAHGHTNVDWEEALKGWWLEAHARARRRGEPKRPTALTPAPAPEPPPLYDAELHAQMQADIVRLCGPPKPSIAQTSPRHPLH